MILTSEESQACIAELTSANEAAGDLAMLASLAARIEPELLRRLRLDAIPTAGAETEADLWFSGVVAARSTSWIVLLPEVAELLRARCASQFDGPRLEMARNVIRWAHAGASPLVQLEDDIHWHTMRGEQIAIEEKLAAIVEALRSENKLPVAQWALRALPRFSRCVRELPGAWVIQLVAEQQLGFRLRLEPGSERVPVEVWPLLRGAMSSTEIFARLVEGGVELSRDPLIGSHRFSAPLTEPVVVNIAPRSERIVVPRDSTVYVRTPHPVELRTIDGTTSTLAASSSEAVDGVMFRFFLLSEITLMSERVELEFEQPAHVIFIAGGIAEKSQKPFANARRRIDSLIERGAGTDKTFVFAVPADYDEMRSDGDSEHGDIREFAAFADGLPHPSMMVQGPTGDFAATLEINGARIGIVGLNTVQKERPVTFNMEKLHAVCGPDPGQWAGSHHFNVLLTRHPTRQLSGDAFAVIAPLFSLHLHGPSMGVETVSEWKSAGSSVVCVAARTQLMVGYRFLEGAARIGTETKLTFQYTDSGFEDLKDASPARGSLGELMIPTRALSTRREMLRPEKWILVAGSARKPSRRTLDTARAIGASLCAAGYGLMTGGWRGVDEEVTKGFAEALGGSSDSAHDAIRHYVGAVEPRPTMAGRRLFFGSSRDAVVKSVEDAAAVVLISGHGGTAWIGQEAVARQKPLIPIPATGGVAKRIGEESRTRLPVVLRNKESRPAELSAGVMQALAARLRVDATSAARVDGLPRVLVLDDDKVWLETIELVLRDDFELTLTTSVNEAFTYVRKARYDLVVLDVRLQGGTSGLDVLERMRRAIPDLRAIMLTEMPDYESALESGRRGALDYVSKAEVAKLAEIAKRALGNRSRPIQVFLCYERTDRAKVSRLYERLVSRGFLPWMDLKSIAGGKRWEPEISAAIDRADYFVFCASTHSLYKEGAMRKEIHMALDRQKGMPDDRVFFIPARLDECALERPLDMFNFVDLSERMVSIDCWKHSQAVKGSLQYSR
jgi:ActR/RegA family two-component response regulator